MLKQVQHDTFPVRCIMLRKARVSDIDSIYLLIIQAAKKGKVLPRSKEELKKVIHHFYVYEMDGMVVGCCALEVYSKKLAEIRSLVVAESYKKQGIGKALVAACLAEAKEKQIFEVLAITDKDAFFEKLGFKKELGGQWPMFLKIRHVK